MSRFEVYSQSFFIDLLTKELIFDFVFWLTLFDHNPSVTFCCIFFYFIRQKYYVSCGNFVVKRWILTSYNSPHYDLTQFKKFGKLFIMWILFFFVEGKSWSLPAEILFFLMTDFWIYFWLASLKPICRDYQSLISRLETEKIDLEYEVARKDLEARRS